jgi:methyltransferase-like protein
MFVGNMPKGAMEKLKGVNDIVRQEQYMDFVSNRRFRTTILCRGGAKLNRSISADQILDFYISGTFKPKDQKAPLSANMEFITKAGGNIFSTSTRPASALMLEIAVTPGRFQMSEIIDAASEKYGIDKAELEKAAKDAGMRLVMAGILNVHSDKANFVTQLSEKPVAFEVARHQCLVPTAVSLTNASGEMIQTDIFNNHIIRYLDGSNDLDALNEKLADHAIKGDIQVRKKNEIVVDKKQLLEILKPAISQRLNAFVNAALLVK